MSEITLLENITELAILNKLRKKYKFEMSRFLNYGDLTAAAAEKGLKVSGNIGGGSINSHFFDFGAITSVVLSEYLRVKVDAEKAMPIPVGFDNISAPRYKGAISKQFPEAVPAGMTDEQADASVVETYLNLEYKPQDPKDNFTVWNVPGIPAKDIIKIVKRNIDINWSMLPKQFYVRVQGSDEDLQLIRDICDDEEVAYHTATNGVHMTNVDRGYYPPLACQLYGYDFGEVDSDIKVHNAPSTAGQAKGEKTCGSSPLTTLPEVWRVMKDVPSVDTYNAVCESAEFKRAVANNKRKLGSNKHKTTSKLLEYWQCDERKSVEEFLNLCARIYKDEEMQAKLLFGLTSHLRADGQQLYRVDLETTA